MGISGLVSQGLNYLDTRTDFWRQQKPMYARKHEKLQLRRRPEASTGKLAPNDYIIRELERIDQAQVEGKYQESLKRAQRCLNMVRSFSEDNVPNKTEVISNLYSCVGNAYLEMGSYDKALEQHQIDFKMGEDHDMEEACSRGLDNMGRVHARRGDYTQAISVWEKKLPLSKSPLESTWLYHEIGRCYLELGKFTNAKDFGEKSLVAAEEAEDQQWQLQASVLVAQSEVKLGELSAALSSFETSLDLARALGDSSAESAIKKAIDEVNTKIAKGGSVTSIPRSQKGDSPTNAASETKSDTQQVDRRKSEAKTPKSGKSETNPTTKSEETEETKPAEEEPKEERKSAEGTREEEEEAKDDGQEKKEEKNEDTAVD